MVNEISIPPSILYIIKTICIFGLIFFPIMIFFGLYYYLSAYVNKKVIDLLLYQFKNNKFTKKYLLILTLIIKFIIFFGLLKLLLQSLITYLFFDFEDPDDLNCEMAEMTKTFATVFSILFFIIYESILLPFDIIILFDNQFSILLTMIKNILNKIKTDNNSSKIENIIVKLNRLKNNHNNKIKPDIKNILNDAVGGMAKGVESFPDKLLSMLASLLKKLTGDNKIPTSDEQFDINKNKIASNISGKLTAPIIYLGIIYLGLYYFLSGSMFIIRIVVFCILVFITLYFIYPGIVLSTIARGLAGFGLAINKIINPTFNSKKDISNLIKSELKSSIKLECNDGELNCQSKLKTNNSTGTKSGINSLNKNQKNISNIVRDFSELKLDFKELFSAIIQAIT